MKNRSSLAIFTAVLSVLSCFVLLPQMRAAPENPEAFSGSNTFDGFHALGSQTANTFNSAFGWESLATQTTATAVTGCGAGTLVFNTADNNTAVGAAALEFNTSGGQNVAVGGFSLLQNVGGSANTAVGMQALQNNVGGVTNAALGRFAGQNTTSNFNVAVGGFSLQANTGGTRNTAVGAGAMESGAAGDDNTAVGELAGVNIASTGNTVVGSGAGTNITTAGNNIYLGVRAGAGVGNEVAFIRIGEVSPPVVYDTFIKGIFGRSVVAGALPVIVDSNGKLGTAVSSRQYKHDIKPMDKASEAILALKPVTFIYNRDDMNEAQFGLVAEDVAQVSEDLVVRDQCGEPLSVRYDAVNAMLLNEFLKEHKKVEEQQASITQLRTEMQTMVAQLKEQAAQIQKVSAQLEVSKPAPQVVVNKP